MSFIAVAVIGGAATLGGAYLQTQAANKAAAAQQQALGYATQNIQQGRTQAIGALTQYLGPYASFGQSIQPTLSSLLTPGPSQTQTLSQLPGFQFARDMAGYGIAAGAGKTGISGTTAVEGGTLESALASQNWTNYINPLLDLYGQGQGAASELGQGVSNIQTGTAGALANLAIGQGNVQAAQQGTLGSIGANALGSIGSQIGNLALLSKLTGGGGLNAGLHMDQGGPYFGR